MERVMVVCPVSRKPVATGQVMNHYTLSGSVVKDQTFTCPLCQQVHTWSAQDAYLEH